MEGALTLLLVVDLLRQVVRKAELVDQVLLRFDPIEVFFLTDQNAF